MFAKLAGHANSIASRFRSFFHAPKKIGVAGFVLLASACITILIVSTPAVHAGWTDDVFNFFSSLLFALAAFFIKLTFFVLKFIIEVAGYNGFIDSPAVTVGWVMIRDLTNMFFVVVLLMIAFGTILGLEHYEYKHLLMKLIMAAVLVNFSRLICGLIIDLAQVVMITFVNGIAATASGNLVNMFQVDKIFKLGNGQAATGSASAVFVSAVAAIAFSVIMLVTMFAFLFIIVARMAMLWVLIAVSPFAFVLNVLHQTEHFAHEWWGKFTSNVISGPIIAFFLWLSFVTVGSGNIHDEIVKHNALQQGQLLQQGNAEEEQTGLTQVMSWENMANFIIAIAILLVGAHMAEELGVAGAHMMGSAGELGKKAAMYASGFQAARWAAPLVGKGLYYGTNMIPGLAGIHPEAWKRRAANLKSRAKSLYYDSKVKSTVKAGEISKAFAVNKEGKFVKKVKVAKKDEKGNILKDEHGNTLYDEKEVEQKGIGDWAKRWLAKGRLEFGAGYDAFHHAYSEDLEATAEAKHEQLDHLASTSSLPIGLEKQKAKEWLEFLEHTGADIKAGKAAVMENQREKILHTLDHYEGAEAEKELKKLGLNDLEIFKAQQGYARFGKSVKSKAESDIISEYVSAEHKIKQQEALKTMLEQNKGRELGMQASEAKATAELISVDIQQARDLQLAEARDEKLKELNRYSEANNVQNTINDQVEQKIKRHSAAGDYVQAKAKTASQLAMIAQQREALKEAIANKEEEAAKQAEGVLAVLEKSLSEMQISNLGTHAAIADGLKGDILKAVGMSPVQSMQLKKEDIWNLQAQDLAELINQQVVASEKGLKEAEKKLKEIYKERADAMLEQKRLKNEKAAGQGSLARAGLYTVDSKTLKTVLTNVSTQDGIDQVIARRQSGLSGSRLTTVVGFRGSVDQVVDSKGEIVPVLSSEESKDIFVKLAAGLTGNNLGAVDEYTKADIGAVFDNSSLDDLRDVLNRLKERTTDKNGLRGLLNFALEKNRMNDVEKITEIKKVLEEISRKK